MYPRKYLGFDESHEVIEFLIFTRCKCKFSLFHHTEVFIKSIFLLIIITNFIPSIL